MPPYQNTKSTGDPIQKQRPTCLGRWARWAATFFTLVLLVLGFLLHLGYFGGPVFVPVPASRAPTSSERGIAAVLLSGDMGFHVGMGPRIAHRLAASGIPVIGVNSLSYFRVRRSPAEIETLIAQAVRRALAQPGIQRIVLIGQSFGADMLHAGLPGLPKALREKILLVALIVPGDTIEFRASPSELFNFDPPDAPALQSASKLDWVPVICVDGAVEQNSLCPLITMPNVTRVTLPGGHPLRRDADRVYAVLRQAIRTVNAP